MKIIQIPPVIKGRPVARRSGFFLNGKDNRWSYLIMFGWRFPWIHVWKGKEKKTS